MAQVTTCLFAFSLAVKHVTNGHNLLLHAPKRKIPHVNLFFFHAPTRAIVNGDIINNVMGRCLAVRLRKSCSPGAVISPMQSKETDSIYTGNALKQSR